MDDMNIVLNDQENQTINKSELLEQISEMVKTSAAESTNDTLQKSGVIDFIKGINKAKEEEDEKEREEKAKEVVQKTVVEPLKELFQKQLDGINEKVDALSQNGTAISKEDTNVDMEDTSKIPHPELGEDRGKSDRH